MKIARGGKRLSDKDAEPRHIVFMNQRAISTAGNHHCPSAVVRNDTAASQ